MRWWASADYNGTRFVQQRAVPQRQYPFLQHDVREVVVHGFHPDYHQSATRGEDQFEKMAKS